MDDSFELTLQIVITVLAGISAQVLAEFLKLPSIVLLLIFGVVLGRDGLSMIQPRELGVGLDVLVSLGVAIILFEGGFKLNLRDLGSVSGSLRNLVTLGTLITLVGGGMSAHWLAEFPWPIAFLYASLVVVTGPTVIGPLLKQVSVDRQVGTLLESEGVLIDPVGAILAVVVLNTILNSNAGPVAIASSLFARFGIGILVGVIGAVALGWLLKNLDFLSEDLSNLVVLAGVWGLFCLSQTIQGESGLMAVVVSGIVLRGLSLPEERLLLRFKGQLTVLFVSVLFILLSADLSIASIFALGWGSLLAVLILMLLIRPLSVVLCTINNGMNWRQKFFLAWVAPKGIISASVASLFAIILTQRGINGGDAIKALVFLTIMMTVFFQGLSAGIVAKTLQITTSEATGAVIIGCNPLSLLIARFFKEQGESVVLIDTDSDACKQAEAENLPVVQSSGLDPDILTEVGIESIGSFVALTNNGEVNLVLAQRALEEFRPPRVLAVFPRNSPSKTKSNTEKVSQAFLPQTPIKVWNQYLSDDQVKLGKTRLTEAHISLQQAHLENLVRSEELLPILLKRHDNLFVMNAEEPWQANDEIIYLLHDSRTKLQKQLSGNRPYSRLVLQKLPEVEEIPLEASPPN